MSEESQEGKKGSALGALSGHTLIYLLGSLGSKAASILLLPILTREDNLSVEDYGVLEVINPTILLGVQLLGFQLDAAMMRHYFESDDPRHRKRVVSTAFLGVLGLTLIACTPLWIGSAWLADHWLDRSDLPHVMRAAAIFLAGMVLTEVALAALRAERRSLTVSVWQLVRLVIEVSLKIVFVVGLSMGVMGLMTGQAIAAGSFLVGFGAWVLVRFGAAFDVGLFRSMVAFSAPMVVAGVCQFALHNADRFMLNELSTKYELGLYGVAYQFGFAVTSVVLGAFLLIWYPLIFSIKTTREQRDLIRAASLHVPAIILFLSLPIALFAPEIVEILTSQREFDPAWRYIPVILVSYLFWGLFQITQTPFYIHKQTRRLPPIVGTAAAINIGLNLILIPRLGAMGAAYSTFLALAALAALTHVAASKLEPVEPPEGRAVTLVLISVAAALALFAMPADPWGVWFAARSAVMIASMAWLIGPFLTRHERAQVVGMIRDKLGGKA